VFWVKLLASITGIPVPGLLNGSVATRRRATLVKIIFLICNFPFLSGVLT
jgi:hypothetical protein